MQASARYKLKQFLEANPCVSLIEYGPESVSGFSPRNMMFEDPLFQYDHQYPEAFFVMPLSLPDKDVHKLLSCFEGANWFFLGLEIFPLRWLKITIDTKETACLRSIIRSVRGFVLIPSSQTSAFGVVNLREPDRYAVLHKPLEPPVLYPCPCCGYLVFDNVGTDSYCPICVWQDDLSQLRFATFGGANKPSLVEAQLNYVKHGTSRNVWQPRFASLTGIDCAGFERDENWRLIDLTIDNIELSSSGDQGRTYPRDRTTLYYWRDTYWRRT